MSIINHLRIRTCSRQYGNEMKLIQIIHLYSHLGVLILLGVTLIMLGSLGSMSAYYVPWQRKALLKILKAT